MINNSKDINQVNAWLETKLQEQQEQLLRLERELQIEAALEKVRTKTMAMQKSAELAQVATILFNQLEHLGAVLWTCGFAICDRNKDVVEKWMSSPDGRLIDHPLKKPAG